MAEQTDVYKLIVEVEGANTIGQLENGLKTLREELKNQKIGSKEFNDLSKAIQDTELQLDSASKTAADAGKGIGAAFGNAASGITSGFQAAFGAMGVFTSGSEQSIEAMAKLQGLMQLREGVAGIKNAVVSMTGLDGAIAKGIKGFNGLKIAIASTGIGLLVLAIGAIITAFSRFDSLMEKLEVSLAGIKGAFDAIIDTLALLGSALIKLFSGDFKGAAEDAADAITGFNDRLKESVKNAQDATIAAQKLEDAEISLIVTQARLRRSIAENREIITDENSTLAQKKVALENARKASEDYYNNEIRLAKESLRILELETKARVELTDDQRRAIEEAKAKLEELEASRANEERTLNRSGRQIAAQAEQIRKEAAEKRKKQIEDDIKYERERLEILGQLTIEKEKEFLKRRLNAHIISRKEYDNAILKLEMDSLKSQQKQEADFIKSESENSGLIAQLEKEQKEDEIKANAEHFQRLQLQLIEQLQSQQITETQYQDQLNEQKRLALETEIEIRELYGEDATDLKIKLAEMEVGIEKKKSEEILKNDEQMYQARIAIAQNAADILTNIADILTNSQNEQNAFAKAAALVRIGIDTAQAISALVRNSEQNPANAVTGGLAGIAQFTAGLARITKNIAEAKRLLGGNTGGGVSPNLSTSNVPNIGNDPQIVRTIMPTQVIKAGVYIKDIKNVNSTLDVVDGNSFVIK